MYSTSFFFLNSNIVSDSFKIHSENEFNATLISSKVFFNVHYLINMTVHTTAFGTSCRAPDGMQILKYSTLN